MVWTGSDGNIVEGFFALSYHASRLVHFPELWTDKGAAKRKREKKH